MKNINKPPVKKTSKKISASKNFSLIVIIIISIVSFTTGIFSIIYATNIGIAKTNLIEMEEKEYAMQNLADYIVYFDYNVAIHKYTIFTELFELYLTYKSINGTNPNEEQAVLDQMANMIDGYTIMVDESYSSLISNIFDWDPFVYEVYLANESAHGFDFIIHRDNYKKYPLHYYDTTSDILISNGMDKEFVDILMNHTLSTYPYKINILWYDLYSVSNLILLLETPINNLRNQKADEQEKVELYENMAIHITIFITIMAIAAILTAQMQIRLQERDDDERFSHLRAEILKDESIFQKRKDRISYFILIIAVIISMASLALIII